ncbi:MAG: hypothetical protein V4714_16485 [Bacteroidota bacterium]
MDEKDAYLKGRGAQFNPDNHFLAYQYQPDDEELAENRNTCPNPVYRLMICHYSAREVN